MRINKFLHIKFPAVLRKKAVQGIDETIDGREQIGISASLEQYNHQVRDAY